MKTIQTENGCLEFMVNRIYEHFLTHFSATSWTHNALSTCTFGV